MYFWVQRFSYLSDLIARTVGLSGFSKEEGLLLGEYLYIFGFGEGLLRGKFLYIFGFVGVWVADNSRRILGDSIWWKNIGCHSLYLPESFWSLGKGLALPDFNREVLGCWGLGG